MFSHADVGIKAFSYLPKYVTITNTGAFGLNTATESFAFYQPSTYSLSDDLTIVERKPSVCDGRRCVPLGLEDGNERPRPWAPISFNGGVTGLPLGDFLLGRMFEFRQATPFRQNITQNYMALYAQDTWRVVAEDHAELRRALGALVPAEQRGRGVLLLRRWSAQGR